MFLWIGIALLVFYASLVVSAIIAVVLDNHQPAETMAWIVTLVSIPIIGLLLYYFFGQDIRREKRFNKKNLDQLTQKVMSKYVSQAGLLKPPKQDFPLIHFLKLHNYSFPFGRNNLHIFTSGDDFVLDLIKKIGNARHHIHLEFFIFLDDAVGRIVRDCLIDAQKRGVKVRLIYDDVGCWDASKAFFRKMEEAGIETVNFLPVKFHRFAHRINYRNHRKLVVIDGKTGYIGGMNIALRYVRPQKGRVWYDTHLRIEGYGVYGIQLLFLSNWFWTTRHMITDSTYYPSFHHLPSGQGVLLQIVSSAPFSSWPAIMMAYNKVFLNSEKYILIQTPYFMPTQSLIEALQTAAMSGVRVQIMLPEKPGGFWMTWCNQSYFGDMLKSGVEIYLYMPGMLHSKVVVSDDHFCSVGSANIDFRSMLDTYEANAFIYDDDMAVKLRDKFIELRKQCRRVELQEWKSRNIRQRFTASFVRIFSPML